MKRVKTAGAHAHHLPSSADDLVASARKGDRDAFGQLVLAHQAAVFGLARRYVGPDDASDVAQRTFVRAYLSIGALRVNAMFGAWLRRITHNLARSELRDRSRTRALADTDDIADETSTWRPTDAELRTRLVESIARLPDKQRRAVELRLLSEQSFFEIGKALGCSEESAKANFHHATRRLRRWLLELTDNNAARHTVWCGISSTFGVLTPKNVLYPIASGARSDRARRAAQQKLNIQEERKSRES